MLVLQKRENILELQYLASCFVWQSTARMEIRVTALYRTLISVLELVCFMINREFKQKPFWATHVNRKWTFCNIRQRFAFIFGRVIPITARQLNITNMAASRCYKKENASLPVDVCRSKTTHFRLTCVTQKRLTSGGRVLLKNDSLPVDVCHSKRTLL